MPKFKVGEKVLTGYYSHFGGSDRFFFRFPSGFVAGKRKNGHYQVSYSSYEVDVPEYLVWKWPKNRKDWPKGG